MIGPMRPQTPLIDLTIRPARREDLAAVAEIYDYYAAHSTCTFAVEPPNTAYWEEWIRERAGPRPAIAALCRPDGLGDAFALEQSMRFPPNR
jgi:L-amino acid N-acyltransferase YncA